jgi:hypothetical protein
MTEGALECSVDARAGLGVEEVERRRVNYGIDCAALRVLVSRGMSARGRRSRSAPP